MIGIEVRDLNNNNDSVRSATLNGCGAVSTSKTFRNFREVAGNNNFKFIRMLDVNMSALLDCAHNNNLFEANRKLDDTTEGGLVWHLTVDGPQSNIDVYAGGSIPTNGNIALRVRVKTFYNRDP